MIIAQNDKAIIRHPDSIDFWWRTPLGSDVLLSEIETIQDHLHNSWGDWSMQMSTCRQLPRINHGKIENSIKLVLPDNHGESDITCDPIQVPFEQDAIQSLVLHHVLDFHKRPHQVLREAANIVAPYGRLTVCGFNRLSPLTLKHAIMGFQGKHSIRRLLNYRQLKDWLHLLGFEIEQVSYCSYEFPSQRWHNSEGFYTRFMGQYLPRLGGSMVVTARKEKHSMTLKKDTWGAISNSLKPRAEIGTTREVANKT